jgi:hypothetical protein
MTKKSNSIRDTVPLNLNWSQLPFVSMICVSAEIPADTELHSCRAQLNHHLPHAHRHRASGAHAQVRH